MSPGTSFELESELEFSIPAGSEQKIAEMLKRAIESNPEMAPHIVIFDQPYAIYQEYGTKPHGISTSHVSSPKHKRKSGRMSMSYDNFGHTEAQKRFIEWAKHRSNGRDPMKLARAAYHIVMKRGLNPRNVVSDEYVGFHPFARPAFYEISASSKVPGSYESIAKIAEAIKDRAIQIMTENDWVASGLLKDSIVCRPLSVDEILERGVMDDEDKQ